jgi:hypothetical protein
MEFMFVHPHVSSPKLLIILMYLRMTLANLNCMHEEIKEQVELGEHLLPFGLECVVFPFAV